MKTLKPTNDKEKIERLLYLLKMARINDYPKRDKHLSHNPMSDEKYLYLLELTFQRNGLNINDYLNKGDKK